MAFEANGPAVPVQFSRLSNILGQSGFLYSRGRRFSVAQHSQAIGDPLRVAVEQLAKVGLEAEMVPADNLDEGVDARLA